MEAKKPDVGGLNSWRTPSTISAQKPTGTWSSDIVSSALSWDMSCFSGIAEAWGACGAGAGVDGAAKAIVPPLIWSSRRVRRAFRDLASRLSSGCAISRMQSSASILRLALWVNSDRVCWIKSIMRTSSPLDS